MKLTLNGSSPLKLADSCLNDEGHFLKGACRVVAHLQFSLNFWVAPEDQQRGKEVSEVKCIGNVSCYPQLCWLCWFSLL